MKNFLLVLFAVCAFLFAFVMPFAAIWFIASIIDDSWLHIGHFAAFLLLFLLLGVLHNGNSRNE